MGYTTNFMGEFILDRPLTPEHQAYLMKLERTRRMKRDPTIASQLPDPLREAVGLPLGDDAEYFVGGTGHFGQDRDSSIIDYNSPPGSQPGFFCQWVPTDDGRAIVWDEIEKFYEYIKWLKYLIQHFLKPWNYMLNGTVHWLGEDPSDEGLIEVHNNVVRVGRYTKTLVYEE
jgi:hypothetical protein